MYVRLSLSAQLSSYIGLQSAVGQTRWLEVSNHSPLFRVSSSRVHIVLFPRVSVRVYSGCKELDITIRFSPDWCFLHAHSPPCRHKAVVVVFYLPFRLSGQRLSSLVDLLFFLSARADPTALPPPQAGLRFAPSAPPQLCAPRFLAQGSWGAVALLLIISPREEVKEGSLSSQTSTAASRNSAGFWAIRSQGLSSICFVLKASM